MIKLKYQTVFNEVDELKEFREPIYTRHNLLHGLPKPDESLSTGTSWVDLPANEEENTALVKKIIKTKRRLRRLKVDTLVVVGIGGSMVGTKAVYDTIRPYYQNKDDDQIQIIFVGYTMNERHLQTTLKYLDNKNYAINVVSLAGKTLEVKVAFNLLLNHLSKKYPTQNEVWKRVIITSSKNSPLHELAESKKNAEFYEIPEGIGGRYSTLTPVGLLPLGVAGIDINQLLEGAYEAYEELIYPIPQNPAYLYACSRAALYSRHYKKNELGVIFEPSMESFMKWWRMIFAESEGKDGWGLFPAIALFTSDLHTLGQWIQDGDSDFTFESFHIIRQEGSLKLNQDFLSEEDKFLGEQSVSDMEYAILKGVLDAHKQRKSYLQDEYDEKKDNPIPHIVFEWDDYTENTIGYALYFFQKAAAMYCLLVGVNPFDQPGVDAYKKAALHYISEGDMYEEDKDVVLDYTPPAVDLIKETETERIEKEMVVEERASMDIDDEFDNEEEVDADFDGEQYEEEVTQTDDFDDFDDEFEDEIAQADTADFDDFAEEVAEDTESEEKFFTDDDFIDEEKEQVSTEEFESIRESSPDSRVTVDLQTGRERVGIEEVGEIRITIKPNREILMPVTYPKRKTAAKKKTSKKPVAAKKKTSKKPVAAKKKTSKKPVAAKKKTSKKPKSVSKKTTKAKKVKVKKSAASVSRKRVFKAKGTSINRSAFTSIKL